LGRSSHRRRTWRWRAIGPPRVHEPATLAEQIAAPVGGFDAVAEGLAISLLFGLASLTLLTVLVILAIYVVMRDDGRGDEDEPLSAPMPMPRLAAAE
jgi:hypothetical protein